MKTAQFAALAIVGLLAACSHSGARNFSINSAPPPAEEPAPEPTPEPQPAPPPAPPSGTLARTTDATNGLVTTALHVTGNTLLGLGDHTNLPSGLPVVGGAVGNVVQGVDAHLNAVAQVQVVGLPVVGASAPGGNQAIGISALSPAPATGSIATVGVLNQGAQQQPLSVNIGGNQVLGTPGPAAVNLGVLNNGTTTGPTPGRSPLGLIGTVTSIVPTPATVPPGGR